jgi:hypothetical protein
LKDWAREGALDLAVVMADAQHAGRGRQGRAWVSPAGNLYLSVLLHPETRHAGLVPLLGGVAVCVALESLGATARLKWPNDVLTGDRSQSGGAGRAQDGSRLSDISEAAGCWGSPLSAARAAGDPSAPAETATPDLLHDTFNGLLAFIVPGPDDYSVAQGVSTLEPGGVDLGVTDILIATLDETTPFLPQFSATVAAILNSLALVVNPTPGGTFLSPFACLSFAEKAAALPGVVFVVGVDTGLTHIAVQQGTPTITICPCPPPSGSPGR